MSATRGNPSVGYYRMQASVKTEVNSEDQNHEQFCTLDTSFASVNYATESSPSNVSYYSTGGSQSSQLDYMSDNTYRSLVDDLCGSEDTYDLKYKIMELENVMLGPNSDQDECSEISFVGGLPILESGKRMQLMQVPVGDLKQMLIACAKCVAEDDLLLVDWLMNELKQMVSVSGDPIQRLAAYLFEGLVARLESSGSSIYKSLRCKEPTGSELLSYMTVLYEVCPYYKFAYMSANGAIAEAIKVEDRVHIIDFQIAMGTQWITLIQALAARPGGPPRLRITGFDDPVTAYARGSGLHLVGKCLSQLAESCSLPFEFHSGAMYDSEVKLEDLNLRPGEALVVNFAYQLHHMPDESTSTRNHRDRLLHVVKGLAPTVVTLVEQELNTNTTPFFPRFLEALDYYTAIFESIDVTLPRSSSERISVEQHCVAKDIVNIIACEGADRVERHELLGKWRSRFAMAGFTQYPLSPLVNATIKTLLEKYSENYRLEEREGALYLGWKKRPLVVSCAWR